MKWVNSAGGPLLFLAEDLLSRWQGAIGGQAKASDYDRACLTDDLIVPISIGNGFGIVLNDEPLQTTWIRSEEEGQGCLIRWKHARDESSVIRHIEQLSRFFCYNESLTFNMDCSNYVLFDSGLPGRDFRKGEYLEIALALGDYEIRTGTFEPDSETSLLIHKFSIIKWEVGGQIP